MPCSHGKLTITADVNYGLRLFCKGYSQSWIQPHFVDMSTKSPSVPILSAAIQLYINQGSSVTALECIGLALRTFRYEVLSYQDTVSAGTLSAGVLLCKLNVSSDMLRPNLCPIKRPHDD